MNSPPQSHQSVGEPPRPQRPLDGVRILDLSASIRGAFAARLLADLGADVISVEPEGGSPLREVAGWWAFIGAGKRSVLLPEATAAIPRLALAADAVITSYRGGIDVDDATRQSLAALDSSIVLELSPFGSSGPYSHWQDTEIVEWALGGYMYFGGTSDRSPLLLPGHQAELHGGMQAAFAALTALHHVRHGGKGQHIEISDWESVLSAHWRLSIMWTHLGEVWKRLDPEAVDFLPCLDGQVFIQRNGRYDENFFALIERPDLVGDPRWSTPAASAVHADELWVEVAKWTSGLPVADVIARAQARRYAASPVNTLGACLQTEQFAARGMVAELAASDGTVRRLPAAPYQLSAAELGPYRLAPDPGADNAAALDATLWPATVTVASGDPEIRAGSGAALDGVKVLELGANWAGPLMTRSMGDLGAQVIKVEGARRPATRLSHYPGNEGGKFFYNRSGYFNKMNRNKLGLSLDITSEAGREVFLKLVAWADVFVENQSPQVLKRLRITYDDLKAVNPRLIMVCVSGYGLSGPLALHAAYGANVEAASGLSSMFGYQPGEMLRTGSFYADPLAGSLGVVAVLAALRQREVTGQGQLVDLALQETVLAFFGADVTNVLAGEPEPLVIGNRDTDWAPQGCYQCYGDDMWLVLSVRSDAEWALLCGVIGRDDLADRADLATAEGRRAAHDELDLVIAGWSAEQDHRDAAERLQAVGVPAAPVLKNWELLADLHLHERQFYVPIPHPDTGVMTYPGFPWKFSGTPARVSARAPRFAEHNDLVLRDILGLSREEIEQLAADGITDTVPTS